MLPGKLFLLKEPRCFFIQLIQDHHNGKPLLDMRASR